MDIYHVKDYLSFLVAQVPNEFEQNMYKNILFEKNKCKRIRVLPNVPFNLFDIQEFKSVVRAMMTLTSIKICLRSQEKNFTTSMYDIMYKYICTLYDILFDLCKFHKTDQFDEEYFLDDEKAFRLALEICEIMKV